MSNGQELLQGPLQGPLHDGTCHLDDCDVGAGVGDGVNVTEICENLLGCFVLAMVFSGLFLVLCLGGSA